MCGIAGYSLSSDSPVGRTLAAQALLAGIAERGADAVGYAYRADDGRIDVTKLRGGASALLDEVAVPREPRRSSCTSATSRRATPTSTSTTTRFGTAPSSAFTTASSRTTTIFSRRYGIERSHEEMTVDSEVIFALMHHRRHDPRALRELHGTMAAGWLDERHPESALPRARISRPLWVGRTETDLFFASTRRALTIVEAALSVRLDARPLKEGRMLEVVAGEIVRKRRFRPDRQLSRGSAPSRRSTRRTRPSHASRSSRTSPQQPPRAS